MIGQQLFFLELTRTYRVQECVFFRICGDVDVCPKLLARSASLLDPLLGYCLLTRMVTLVFIWRTFSGVSISL